MMNPTQLLLDQTGGTLNSELIANYLVTINYNWYYRHRTQYIKVIFLNSSIFQNVSAAYLQHECSADILVGIVVLAKLVDDYFLFAPSSGKTCIPIIVVLASPMAARLVK